MGLVDSAAVSALTEFGLRLEAAAKLELRPGRGVITGTLRRSIHMSGLDYQWEGDDTAPGSNTPERGGQSPDIQKRKGSLAMVFGSGLVYAMPVHQGHRSFPGYHFITDPYARLLPTFPDILEKHSKALLAGAE